MPEAAAVREVLPQPVRPRAGIDSLPVPPRSQATTGERGAESNGPAAAGKDSANDKAAAQRDALPKPPAKPDAKLRNNFVNAGQKANGKGNSAKANSRGGSAASNAVAQGKGKGKGKKDD